MAESSRPWDGVSVGDAVAAPYDAATEWPELWMGLLNNQRFADKGFVLFKELNELNVAVSAPNVTVDTGRAFVWGTYYGNDSTVTIAIPTPAGATRIDRIVLRKDWVAQTVRITRIAGAEGGGVPSMGQTPGVTWDVPLASISVTTAGAITLRAESLTQGRLYEMLPYLAVPECWAYSTANQSIQNVNEAVIYNAAQEKVDDMWDAANPTRVTITHPGLYSIEVWHQWDFSALAGLLQAGLMVNGVAFSYLYTRNEVANGASNVYYGRQEREFDAGDYLEIMVIQGQQANLDLEFSSDADNRWRTNSVRVRFLRPMTVA